MCVTSHSMHECSSQDARGLVPWMQGNGLASAPGGIMEVIMWLPYHYYVLGL